ncbi:hypothetical protein DFH07DRAFT_781735 [Mycena maculata]|uniref:Reverse transcriptase domain-containing protein n=1 Tax=Mycena maculata TaxID=230809 RepID=A0AAD7HXR8_9AGAR|nr:hypothetical protein DFH07DRAFT_781735 [Mycena maculata]
MSHLEHADDMAIVSYSAEGLQRHLTTFARWCGNNMLEANASKSWVMLFGPIPKELPTFTINGHKVGYTDCFCYVGITFQSTHKNVFFSHYTSKASMAHRSGHAVLGIEAYISNLPPKEGRLLYMACIDPHLMSGADVIIDVDDSALAHLEKNLHSPVVLPLLPQLTADTCDVLGKKVYISAMKYLDAEVTKSTRLYMLHGRLEPLDGEPAKKIAMVLRHYLELVANAKHRKALTRLLTYLGINDDAALGAMKLKHGNGPDRANGDVCISMECNECPEITHIPEKHNARDLQPLEGQLVEGEWVVTTTRHVPKWDPAELNIILSLILLVLHCLRCDTGGGRIKGTDDWLFRIFTVYSRAYPSNRSAIFCVISETVKCEGNPGVQDVFGLHLDQDFKLYLCPNLK